MTEAQLSSLASIRDVYGDGHLYTMDYTADYRLDDVMAEGIGSYDELRLRLGNLLGASGPELEEPPFGCTIFIAKNRAGHVLVGRNYDFRDPHREPGVMVCRSFKDGAGANFGVGNTSFLDFRQGQLSEPSADRRPALLFPYMSVDGANRAGVFIGVLVVPGRGTVQDRGKKPILSTVVTRAVLDKAETVQDAIDIFDSYDLKLPSRVRDFHYFVADAKGNSAAIEFDEGSMVVTGTDVLTNFYLAPGLPKSNEGKDRYEAVKAVLSYRGGSMEPRDMMDLLRLVSQPYGPKGKSDTLWSAVYDLSAGELDIAVSHRYEEAKHFSL